MHITLTLSMFLKFVDFVSHQTICGVANDLKQLNNLIDDDSFTKRTIENYILALDIKKWRIAHTTVVYKSDVL